MRLLVRGVGTLMVVARWARGIEYKFPGWELPGDHLLWSHEMTAVWLRHEGFAWQAAVALQVELSGALLDAALEDGSLGSLLSRGGGALPAEDVEDMRAALAKVKEACESAARCGAASELERAGRAVLSVDWRGRDARQRAAASLYGQFVGDALGMPTMWRARGASTARLLTDE